MHAQSILAAIIALGLMGCSAVYSIQLRNESTATVVPYPVVVDPPPPHREADPQGAVGPGVTASMDPTGFNPLYYAPGRELSLTFQFSLDLEPAQILVRLNSHVVEPGQEGTDAALQPTLVEEMLFEPIGKDLTFVLGTGTANDFPVVMEEGL